jgi:riboflavin transporter FmnP
MTEESKSIMDLGNDEEEKEAIISEKAARTLEVAGSAIFGALSIIIGALLAPSIPRIAGWFIAIVDPISIIWITAFLLFGVRAGIFTTLIGTVGLMPFDPTTWVGPSMKAAATLSTMLVAIIALELYKRKAVVRSSKKLKRPKNYVIFGALGLILRIFVMVILNVLVFTTLYSSELNGITLEFLGLPDVTGITAILVGAPLINLWQGAIDLLIPYLVVFGLNLDEKFQIW